MLKKNNLDIKVDALLAQYSSVYQEFLAAGNTGMQALVVLVTGAVALIGYATEFKSDQIFIVVPLFITSLGSISLFLFLTQISQRCMLAILESNINTLIPGRMKEDMFANSAFLWGGVFGDTEKKYPYSSPLRKYVIYTLIVDCIIIAPGYIWSLYKGFLQLNSVNMVVSFAYVAVFIIGPSLLIIWAWISIGRLRTGTISEINRLSKCPK